MPTVRQMVDRATTDKDAHRRQVELVRASLLCRPKRRSPRRRSAR